MQENEYHKMAAKENKYWWFIGRRLIIDFFLQRLCLKKNPKILDIGSGTGSNVNLLSNYGELFILEPNFTAYEYLKNKNFDIKKITLGKCPESLNYKKKYDLICLFDVLEHIENDANVINAICNILTSKGNIIITVPAYNWLWGEHDIKLMHKRRYTLTQIKKLIPKNLEIVTATYFNTFLFPFAVIERMIGKILRVKDISENYFFNTFFKIIFKSERNFLKFFNFPFGLSILLILKNK